MPSILPRIIVILFSCVLLAPAAASAAPPPRIQLAAQEWHVVEAYRYDEERRFERGWNRGVDAIPSGGVVRAALPGTVRFAGTVAGRRVVTVAARIGELDVVTTYTGLRTVVVRAGDAVDRSTRLGTGQLVHVGAYDLARRSRYLPIERAGAAAPAGRDDGLAAAVARRLERAIDGGAVPERIDVGSVEISANGGQGADGGEVASVAAPGAGPVRGAAGRVGAAARQVVVASAPVDAARRTPGVAPAPSDAARRGSSGEVRRWRPGAAWLARRLTRFALAARRMPQVAPSAPERGRGSTRQGQRMLAGHAVDPAPGRTRRDDSRAATGRAGAGATRGRASDVGVGASSTGSPSGVDDPGSEYDDALERGMSGSPLPQGDTPPRRGVRSRGDSAPEPRPGQRGALHAPVVREGAAASARASADDGAPRTDDAEASDAGDRRAVAGSLLALAMVALLAIRRRRRRPGTPDATIHRVPPPVVPAPRRHGRIVLSMPPVERCEPHAPTAVGVGLGDIDQPHEHPVRRRPREPA